MLLARIRRWIWNRRRLIFRFYDGSRIVGVDPIQVNAVLHEHPAYLRRHLAEAISGDVESIRIVAGAACDAFGVSPFSVQTGRGMTVAERVDLMLSFDAFLLALKKNIALSPMLPISTGVTSPNSSEPTTADSSVST